MTATLGTIPVKLLLAIGGDEPSKLMNIDVAVGHSIKTGTEQGDLALALSASPVDLSGDIAKGLRRAADSLAPNPDESEFSRELIRISRELEDAKAKLAQQQGAIKSAYTALSDGHHAPTDIVQALNTLAVHL